MAAAKRAGGRKRLPKHKAATRGASKKPPAANLVSMTAVRRSFYDRSLKLIERIAATAPEDGLVDALSAPTDVGTVARALSDSAVIGSAVDELEPFAAAIARGAEHKQALIAEAGGLLTTTEVAALLGISRQAVYKQRRQRKLLAVPHGGEEKFPAIQFGQADGRPLPGLARILEALGLEGAWGSLDFLVTPDDDALEGFSPIDMLRAHPDRLDEVVSLAATQGEHGAG